MGKLKKKLSKELVITKSSNLVRDFADSLPIDLVIDIFSRVDAKSIGRCCCVSKLWEYILGRQDFTELFLSMSMTRPRILFIFEFNRELLVYSAPQPRNPYNDSSLVVTRYKRFPFLEYFPTAKFSLAFGLVLIRNENGRKRVVRNFVNGEAITLPEGQGIVSYLGYDPINKQYKVLCMRWIRYGEPNHRILTLEYGKRLWRTIQDPIGFHDIKSKALCVNGVLYYKARCEGSLVIVCFDFRSEEFRVMNIDKDMLLEDNWTLFNYKGNLGAHQYMYNYRSGEGLIKLWVMEDVGKHKWSKHIYKLPSLWQEVIGYNIEIVGMVSTGEIVFSPLCMYENKPFYLAYYNVERNTLTKVNIQLFEKLKYHAFRIRTFLDYVEDMVFL